ncbi:MAG: glutathione S-transferase family protein [Hyphomicrobiales bacterium]|nr:glutathione S-transferase family protein [Hyphomicrobiales bacterium]
MVQLADTDIATREVLGWKGLHLFHFHSSSCSQKTRIALNFKDAEWTSHEIDLPKNENLTPWYLGINPRGLVPTLVIDGAVHIESNDILLLLEQRLAGTKLIPEGMETRVANLLHHEDDLHLDLRTLTFRFTQPRGRAPKSPEALAQYRAGGTGTVGGLTDANKLREIDFWETIADHGITDEAVQISADRFHAALSGIDHTLSASPYVLGDSFSIVDIAWFIYVNRLMRCTYPVKRLHPNVIKWFEKLREQPQFASEITVPPEVEAATEENHRRQAEARQSLCDITGL